MFAKRLFYVSAGLLCLALAYHLGARSAGAQGGGLIQVAEVEYLYGTGVAVVQGRTILTAAVPNEPGPGLPVQALPPVPGSWPIIAVNNIGPAALLENGDVYVRENNDWLLKGNMLSGATPALRETWGAMKSRYRGERGAAQPAPQGR